jgi:nitroimidazol reductase NimA-like FMN-containing flavoprotein (pyridoxamine 5'-phosphate oxidase superfamily)
MSGTQGVGDMACNEVMAFVKESRVGVLSVVDGNRPYAVAVEHYFDGKHLWVLVSSREGQRKIECLKKNPNACFTIYQSRRQNPEIVKKGIRCRSVLFEGKCYVDGIKETVDKDGKKIRAQRLRFDIDETGNWQCPGNRPCDYTRAWFDRYPELAKA